MLIIYWSSWEPLVAYISFLHGTYSICEGCLVMRVSLRKLVCIMHSSKG